MSGARFAPLALRLSGAAIRSTGWAPDTFWNATPTELFAILAPDPAAGAPAMPPPLARAEFDHLMETDHDRRSD